MTRSWWGKNSEMWIAIICTTVGILAMISLLGFLPGCSRESSVESVQRVQPQTAYENPFTEYGEVHNQACRMFVSQAGGNTDMSFKELKAVFASSVDVTEEDLESLFRDMAMFAHNYRTKGLDIASPSPYIDDYPIEDCIDILPDFYVTQKERTELKLYLGTLRDELFGLPVETPAGQLELKTDVAQFCQSIGTSSRELWTGNSQQGSNGPQRGSNASVNISTKYIARTIYDAMGATIASLLGCGFGAAWVAAACSIAFHCAVNSGWDFNPPSDSAFWLRTSAEDPVVWRSK